ncbi:hypothetical protein LPJ60_003941 [Coemansia sp. RSA 2675]|nr:hypothetical protein LPJ60_003941 [Coemansia sp. RSA 2675]
MLTIFVSDGIAQYLIELPLEMEDKMKDVIGPVQDQFPDEQVVKLWHVKTGIYYNSSSKETIGNVIKKGTDFEISNDRTEQDRQVSQN